jgi:UDP-N-acetylglucosamine/UDP-N-acetylgalactosamine diphosphorylase
MSREYKPENVAALKAEYTSAGQGHVFNFWDSLSEGEKESLFHQLDDIKPHEVNGLRELALNPPKTDQEPIVEPLPDAATASIFDSDPSDIQNWNEHGLDLIAQGKVAVVLMAGGQGTRLGSKAPKGCFNIGLPSAKSLFQIQAERILKVQELAAKKAGKAPKDVLVPWYIMTSGPTRGPTEKWFKKEKLPEGYLKDEKENDTRQQGKPYFGLEKENVVIFEQGVLPCIANDGKIMLESKGKVAVAPDGNGGIYKALKKPSIPTKDGLISVVDDMKKRGVEHIHAYCVDNCLAKVADPVFIGFSAKKQVQIATKVVRKDNAEESVGLILQKNGKPDVVEYSEIDSETAHAKDPKQPQLLKFRAANIVNHYYSISSLEKDYTLLPHVARKKIPCVDLESGESVKPSSPNGIKLEQFVFDNFKELELNQFACLEVKREDEFSPLKNGLDKPDDNQETSKKHIMAQGKRWLEAAGATVKVDGVEVSPLDSYVSLNQFHLIDPILTALE